MKIEAKHFEYLDTLRESGVTNMFGAAPYVAEKFGLDKTLARAVLSAWMETFDGETSAEDRIEKLNAKV